MTVHSSKLATVLMAEAVKSADGPFFKDGDDTCLRYDEIEFRLIGDKRRNALVTFFWNGEEVYTLTTGVIDLKFGDTVRLTGCRGHMPVSSA